MAQRIFSLLALDTKLLLLIKVITHLTKTSFPFVNLHSDDTEKQN